MHFMKQHKKYYISCDEIFNVIVICFNPKPEETRSQRFVDERKHDFAIC